MAERMRLSFPALPIPPEVRAQGAVGPRFLVLQASPIRDVRPHVKPTMCRCIGIDEGSGRIWQWDSFLADVDRIKSHVHFVETDEVRGPSGLLVNSQGVPLLTRTDGRPKRLPNGDDKRGPGQ